MHHYDRREAQLNIGMALEALGWQLFGLKEDRSDSMTDYFDPASWVGVAVKDGVLAAVDVSAYDVESRSGKPIIKTTPVASGPCERCEGSGKDPLGWTLREARESDESARAFNSDLLRARHQGARERGATVSRVDLGGGGYVMHLTGDVVSPIPFDDAGQLRCVTCGGSGERMGEPLREEVGRWPVFQANPKGRTWHVERDGRIIASGVGLQKCLEKSFARELAQRIDSLAHAAPSQAAPVPAATSGATITRNAAKKGLEVRFPSRPADEVLAPFKAEGWRWSRFGRCWYHRDTPANLAFAKTTLGIDHVEGE